MQRSLAPRLPLARRRSLGFLTRARRLALARLAARRGARVALICAALALAALGGGWLWLRSSSLVAIERVQLIGVHGPEQRAIEVALRGAARRMTTLDLDAGALRDAVAAYPVVRSLSASTHFPHGLSITVQEQPPVLALESGGWRTAVADDGVVLGPALLSAELPLVHFSGEPAAGRELHAPALRAMLAVMGAAPAALARRVSRLAQSSQGLALSMHNGLTVFFGDAGRARAKWLALERVLADPSSRGASYVDVRLPERPAAGFPQGAAPNSAAGTGAGGEEGDSALAPGSSEATIAALAEQLREDSASDGGVPATAPASGESAQAGSEDSSASSGETEASAPPVTSAEQPAQTAATP